MLAFMVWSADGFFWYFVCVMPPMLLGMWAQAKVRGAWSKYQQVPVRSGMTGAQAASAVLRASDLYEVGLERVPGELSDHYDPSKKILRLSPGVYQGSSLASVAIAAHEAGHAIQDAQGYAPLKLRHAIYPIVAFANAAWMVMAGIGMVMMYMGMLGQVFIQLAVIVFSIMAVFSIITLPVEFDASRRAMALLTESGIITQDEVPGAKKVLNAAALTYVASTLMAIGQLMYFLMLSRRN